MMRMNRNSLNGIWTICRDLLYRRKQQTSIADQSDDREAFAEQFLSPLFEQEIAKREKMEEPTEEELRAALLEQLDGVVFIH